MECDEMNKTHVSIYFKKNYTNKRAIKDDFLEHIFYAATLWIMEIINR